MGRPTIENSCVLVFALLAGPAPRAQAEEGPPRLSEATHFVAEIPLTTLTHAQRKDADALAATLKRDVPGVVLLTQGIDDDGEGMVASRLVIAVPRAAREAFHGVVAGRTGVKLHDRVPMQLIAIPSGDHRHIGVNAEVPLSRWRSDVDFTLADGVSTVDLLRLHGGTLAGRLANNVGVRVTSTADQPKLPSARTAPPIEAHAGDPSPQRPPRDTHIVFEIPFAGTHAMERERARVLRSGLSAGVPGLVVLGESYDRDGERQVPAHLVVAVPRAEVGRFRSLVEPAYRVSPHAGLPERGSSPARGARVPRSRLQ
jgi:hypothetical protein